MSFSCATLARRYPLSGRRSAPTMESATWCPTPAAFSAASRCEVDVVKKSSTASGSNDGEFVTSTTTSAPASASASPSPVYALTPDRGDAATASCPCSVSRATTFDPMRPVPPMTTIFMRVSLAKRRSSRNSQIRVRSATPRDTHTGRRPLMPRWAGDSPRRLPVRRPRNRLGHPVPADQDRGRRARPGDGRVRRSAIGALLLLPLALYRNAR